jgi:hypothetical protein
MPCIQKEAMNKRQLLEKISASPNNVRFADLVALIEALG